MYCQIHPNEKLNHEKLLKHMALAGFSDVFRFNLLDKMGGWWSDTDVICLKNQSEWKKLRDGRPLVVSRQSQNIERDGLCGTSVLFFNSRHAARLRKKVNMLIAKKNGTPLEKLLLYLGTISHTKSEKPIKFKWTELGPGLLTNYIVDNDLMNALVDSHHIYPVHWSKAMLFINEDEFETGKKLIERSRAIHLWDAVLTTRIASHPTINLNNIPKNTLLGYLLNLYE